MYFKPVPVYTYPSGKEGGTKQSPLGPFSPSFQMRATPLPAPAGAPSRKKQLDLDSEWPIKKRARSGPQPRPAPCLLPPSPPPAAARAPAMAPTLQRLGPFILLEPEEGGRAYRALHRPTGTEYTCKVCLRAWEGSGLQRVTAQTWGVPRLIYPCVHWGSSQGALAGLRPERYSRAGMMLGTHSVGPTMG